MPKTGRVSTLLQQARHKSKQRSDTDDLAMQPYPPLPTPRLASHFGSLGILAKVTHVPEHCQEQTADGWNSIFGFSAVLLFLFSSWHHVLERLGALLLEFRVGHWFARQHLIPHGGVVDEDRFNECSLRQVFRLQPLVGIHI